MKSIFLFALAGIISCSEQGTGGQSETLTPVHSNSIITNPEPIVINKDSLLLHQTKLVLTILKNKDYTALAAFIHPVNGIRFSPYAYIHKNDRHFSREAFLQALKKQERLLWGTYSGRGDSIMLTLTEYFGKFVYDVDFLHAEKTTVNYTNSRGSAINNQEEYYKGLGYTESYFSGFDEKYGGMDWRGLRLIFQEVHGGYFLAGIVHDEWTP